MHFMVGMEFFTENLNKKFYLYRKTANVNLVNIIRIRFYLGFFYFNLKQQQNVVLSKAVNWEMCECGLTWCLFCVKIEPNEFVCQWMKSELKYVWCVDDVICIDVVDFDWERFRWMHTSSSAKCSTRTEYCGTE